jgi:YYY domain-containing protein
MNWLIQSLWWYAMMLILGIIFFPLTKKIFGSFFNDVGYPFAKTIGLICLSYAMFALSTLHILPFAFISLIFLIILATLGNYFLLDKKQSKKPISVFMIAEELMFLFAFIFWVIVRGQEPSIHGLEKFMDFGFMNSILKTTYFPPADMWLAGHTINYYYFGHLSGAVLTKLSGLNPQATYNLILATIFGLAITQTFSLCFNIVYKTFRSFKPAVLAGLLGSFIVNLAGNLHTIYLFTKGYPNDNPIPFWKIWSGFNPQSYWYPNATRFIPFTIHEFPIYSYVVADLHGHVFDIPFVLLTIALIFKFFIASQETLKTKPIVAKKKKNIERAKDPISWEDSIQQPVSVLFMKLKNQTEITAFIKTHAFPLIFGFMLAIHYMTNAWDLLIYGFLISILFFLAYGFTKKLLINLIVLGVTYFIFSLPFSSHFSSIVTSIGVNCSPAFLVNLHKMGPFLFEKGNCQVSPPWMLFVLWGFFWVNFVFLGIYTYIQSKNKKLKDPNILRGISFSLILFIFSTFLILVPEFFYFKDIYPNHFRANTMFKLGYQAFIMMGIASTFTFSLYKLHRVKSNLLHYGYLVVFIPLFCLIAIYPTFAIPSFYGSLTKTPQLDGSQWIKTTYPEYAEIISYLNQQPGQPIILEAQGDSYTDFNVVSSYTGFPTIAGWWVHEWLWRDDSNAVGNLIPSLQIIYESGDITQTIQLLKKYHVKYIVIGTNERSKYTQLNESKFNQIARLVLTTKEGNGEIYRFDQ